MERRFHVFHPRRFSSDQRNGQAALPSLCRRAADTRLPLPFAAQGRGREPPVREPVRDLAGRRPLQMAGHAGQRRRRAVFDRRCHAAREIHGVGAHGSAYAAQSAVPLDAPRAEALLRHRRAAGREERARHLGASQCPACHGRSARARNPEEVPREGGLHHRRSDGRPCLAQGDRGFQPRDPRVSHLPARQSAQRPPAGGLQGLDGPAVRCQQRGDHHVSSLSRRHPQPPRPLPRRWAAGSPTTA